ncbi:MAG: hypothetical protein AMXMBFR83_12190 [Phycisphaerae bacterium]
MNVQAVSMRFQPQSDSERVAPAAGSSLVIVIVCYKAADLTVACLGSLAPEVARIPGAKVVVCENGTGPESVETLREAIDANGWSAWVELKAISPNRGFSGGNNAVLGELLAADERPEFVLLLNADTIVRPGALAELLSAARDHPRAGIVGPRLEWPDGQPQQSCFNDCTPASEFFIAARTGALSRLFGARPWALPVSDEPVEVEWTTFACALIRGQVLAEVGLLDEGFFLYFDDPDYCRRARAAGWKVLHWPAARVVHLRGQSNPVKSLTARLQRRPAYWYASRARYYAKYYGRVGLWTANLLWTLGRTISKARELAGLKRERHVCEREWLDIWTHCADPLKMPVAAGDRS